MLLNSLPRPAIIAHRGASAYAPENTLAAFKLALEQGADAVELDAKLSSDGQVAVIHDQTVNRTTPAAGKVRDHRMADLHKLDAGSHFDVAFMGEPVPSLEEVFKAVGQLTYINVELTNYGSTRDSLPEKVAALVKQYKLSQRVIFSSFSVSNLIRIRRLLPEAPVGLLVEKGWRGAMVRLTLGRTVNYQSYHPEKSDVTPKLVQANHKRGRKVFVYTVNDEKDIQRAFEMDVDGIFTDDPPLAKSVLARLKQAANKAKIGGQGWYSPKDELK
jgi:glycerophosphoryl diester phosphodiesterase